MHNYSCKPFINDLAAIVLTNLSQNNAEIVVNFALNKGICVVCAKPNMMYADFIDIQVNLGRYALVSEDDNGCLLIEYGPTADDKVVFLSDYRIEKSLKELDYNWSDNEVAFVLYTSGSTGRPKGVCHSLQNLLHSVEFFVTRLEIKPQTNILTFAPIDSIGGFKLLLVSLLKLAKVELVIPNGPLGWLNSLCSIKPDILCCSPQLLESAIKCERFINAEPFACTYYTGGALLAEASRILFQKTFNAKVFDGYGTTETGGSFWINEAEKQAAGFEPQSSQLHGYTLHKITGQDDVFKLSVQCKSNLLGYLGDEFITERDYQTGDIVQLIANKIHLVGRENRSFKSKDGLYILHAEVLEQALKQIHYVNDAFVANEFNLELQSHVCYLDTEQAIDLSQATQTIAHSLGLAYSRIGLAYGKIRRNADGKILNVLANSHWPNDQPDNLI